MSVEMEGRARCGGSGCDSKICAVGGGLCVVNEGLGGEGRMLAQDGECWFKAGEG